MTKGWENSATTVAKEKKTDINLSIIALKDEERSYFAVDDVVDISLEQSSTSYMISLKKIFGTPKVIRSQSF